MQFPRKFLKFFYRKKHIRKEKNEDKLRKFFEPAVEVSGSAIGTGVGLIYAGPDGAIAGSIVAPIFIRTCKGLYDRIIAYRDRSRVGTAIAYSIIDIDERLRNGEFLRDDGFIDPNIKEAQQMKYLRVSFLKVVQNIKRKKQNIMVIFLVLRLLIQDFLQRILIMYYQLLKVSHIENYAFYIYFRNFNLIY